MHRADYHIIRKARGWHLENADGATLKVFHTAEEAFEAARARALEYQRRGFDARVTLHHPGKSPGIHDFPGNSRQASRSIDITKE